jgi:hypothetical protein
VFLIKTKTHSGKPISVFNKKTKTHSGKTISVLKKKRKTTPVTRFKIEEGVQTAFDFSNAYLLRLLQITTKPVLPRDSACLPVCLPYSWIQQMSEQVYTRLTASPTPTVRAPLSNSPSNAATSPAPTATKSTNQAPALCVIPF